MSRKYVPASRDWVTSKLIFTIHLGGSVILGLLLGFNNRIRLKATLETQTKSISSYW